MSSDFTEAHPADPTAAKDAGSDHVAFDVREVPFSRRGCWLDLSPGVAPHRTSDLVHLVSHRNGFHAVVAMTPELAGAPVEVTWLAGPGAFSWAGLPGTVDAAFDDSGALHLRGSGLGLRLSDAAARLTPFTGTYLFTDPLDGARVFTSYETGRRYRLTVVHGATEVAGAEALGEAARAVLLGADGRVWEAVVRETTSSGPGAAIDQPFDEVVESARADFADYLAVVAPWRTPATPAAGLAAYVMWSATVGADGFLRRECVLMSKHWMDKVWSWDHCFNALGPRAGTGRRRARPAARAVRPPGRQRCAARLDQPLRAALQLRQAPHPRLGPAATARDRRAAAHPGRARGALRRPRPVDDLLDRAPASPRPRDPLLPARQRQRLGQLDHLRRRPGHRVARPGGVPRAPARGARRPGR